MSAHLIDISGQSFGSLTVVERSLRDGEAHWVCSCSCGTEVIARGSSLRKGRKVSCGCGRSEAARQRTRRFGVPDNTKHGHNRREGSPTPTYVSWMNMIQRTTNPRNPAWKAYGGRGIGVCDRWRTFAYFLADMGERPEGLTLDRIDNDRGYEPGNCRWATWTQQRLNQRRMEPAR